MAAPIGSPQGPRTDDRPLWDVVFALFGYPAALIAHKMGIFELLGKHPGSILEISKEKNLHPRPATALLSANVALGFLTLNEGVYSLSPASKEYLLEGSPHYFGHYWDLLIELHHIFSLSGLESAIRSDSPQVYNDENFYESHRDEQELAAKFTRGMRSISGSAWAWPDLVDLSRHRMMLDVGGGPGSHAIGAVRRWPDLDATIFDLDNVCGEARRYVAGSGLDKRIGTCAGDMWEDPFPPADLHFYSYVFHNWSPAKCGFLAEKSFESLPPGGRIIIHQVLYDEDKTGPFAAAAFAVEMLAWTEGGEQYTPAELSALLQGAGFRDIETKPTFGYCSMVTGIKPGALPR